MYRRFFGVSRSWGERGAALFGAVSQAEKIAIGR